MFFKKKKELPPLTSLEMPVPSISTSKSSTGAVLPSMPVEVPETLPELGKPIETQPTSLVTEIEKYKDLEVPELEEKKPLELKNESFVKIEHYSDILNTISEIKSMLSGAAENINRLIEIKNVKESQLDSWQNSLQNIGKKLTDIDKILFEKVIE